MKIWILLPALVCISATSDGQCIKGNCVNGKGVFRYKTKAVYSGDFYQGRPHGTGTYLFSNGNKYIGKWKQNVREGNGKMIFASGDRYEGSFVRNRFHGFGIYYFDNGNRYEGYWEGGKPNGQGTLYKKHADDVTGFWKEGKLLKQSTPEPESVVYEKLPDCNLKYCAEGLGAYTYGDGSRYEGTFLNGLPHGKGICFYANGDRYSGSWFRHKPHGQGTMEYASGDILEGLWQQGKFTNGKKLLSSRDEGETKIYALLVGVSRYDKFETLKYTDDDAYRLYAFLKSPEGGALPDDQIQILIDESATQKNIVAAMDDILIRADENDAIFCFFSGHGLNGMFLPIDSDGYRNTLPYEEVKNRFSKAKAKQKLFLADACYSGSLLSARTTLTQSMEMLYERLSDSEGGTAFLLSSKPEEYSLESRGLRQGVFSHFLIKGLKGSADVNVDRIVTLGELYKYVYAHVRSYTKQSQTPIIAGAFDENMPVGMIR